MRKKIIALFLSCMLGISCLASCGNESGNKTDSNALEVPSGNTYQVETKEVQVEKDDLRNRVMGGWAGHVIGNLSGYEYVWTEGGQPLIAMEDKYWEPDGQVLSGTLGFNILKHGPYEPYYTRILEGKVKSDDDIHIDLFNQWILNEYGPNVGQYEVTDAWRRYVVGDAAGGEDTMKIIQTNDYIAPYTGMYVYGNTMYTATEPWIENETLGLLFPYMPVSAEGLADVFTTLTGDGYGVYLGKLCAIAYSYALTEDSAPVALEKAFSHMEKSNMIYEAYQYVLECYDKDPVDWRSCVRGLVENTKGNNTMGLNSQIDLYINAGFIFTGIIYGENNFEKSVKIASLAGYDGDCTAATVAGLVGTVIGYDEIPDKYKEYVNTDTIYVNDTTWFAHIGGDYPAEQTFGDILDMTMSNMESQIVANGGSVEEKVYTINKQNYTGKQQVEIVNYDFEEDDTQPWQVEGPAALTLAENLHTGKNGGNIRINSFDEDVKVYQELELVEGDYYQIVLYVSAELENEFRIFAEGENGYEYHSYVTSIMSLDRFLRAELTFCATDSNMKIGIHIPAQSTSAAFLTIDDLSVLNVSHKVARTGQNLEAEKAEATSNVTVALDDSASGGKAVTVGQNDAVKFTVEGDSSCYQNIRLYYSNKDFTATVKVTVDGYKTFQLPLLPQGETSGFSSGNYVDFGMNLGGGTHEIIFKLLTDNELQIDKIEVRTGDISLHAQEET